MGLIKVVTEPPHVHKPPRIEWSTYFCNYYVEVGNVLAWPGTEWQCSCGTVSILSDKGVWVHLDPPPLPSLPEGIKPDTIERGEGPLSLPRIPIKRKRRDK